jgi:outer membrane lipoprotein
MRVPSIVRAGVTVSLLGLAGCVTMPQQLNGAVGSVDPAAGTVAPGTSVRWGGVLLATLPMADRTCFEILSRPLESGSGRPAFRYADQGDPRGTRFMACQGGFVDPEAHRQRSEVTVMGQVSGTQTRRVGQYGLTEPVVSITGIQWWHPRPVMYPDPYWGYPYGPWGPYPGWYGGWYGYGPGPVIVVRHGR